MRLERNENGSAILYTVMVGAFVLILAYALSTYLGQSDTNSRRLIDRTVYLQTGGQTAGEVSNPSVVKDAESTRNDTPYD